MAMAGWGEGCEKVSRPPAMLANPERAVADPWEPRPTAAQKPKQRADATRPQMMQMSQMHPGSFPHAKAQRRKEQQERSQ